VNNDIDGAIQQMANILEEWYPQLQKKEQDWGMRCFALFLNDLTIKRQLCIITGVTFR
jgi:hypothetical protein